jgi:hypothetical protein
MAIHCRAVKNSLRGTLSLELIRNSSCLAEICLFIFVQILKTSRDPGLCSCFIAFIFFCTVSRMYMYMYSIIFLVFITNRGLRGLRVSNEKFA